MIVAKNKIKLVQVTFKGEGLKDTFVVDSQTAHEMVTSLNEKATTSGGLGETTEAAIPAAKRRGRPKKAAAEPEAAWPQG